METSGGGRASPGRASGSPGRVAVFVVVIVVAGFTLAWAPGWAPGWVLGRHTLCLLSADQGRSLSWDLLLGSRVSGQQCCRSRRTTCGHGTLRTEVATALSRDNQTQSARSVPGPQAGLPSCGPHGHPYCCGGSWSSRLLPGDVGEDSSGGAQWSPPPLRPRAGHKPPLAGSASSPHSWPSTAPVRDHGRRPANWGTYCGRKSLLSLQAREADERPSEAPAPRCDEPARATRSLGSVPPFTRKTVIGHSS